MTKQQNRIAEQIRKLHSKGAALNISAMRHAHPDLLRSVYSVKPFWGWKAALEDSGISYADIRTTLRDYCLCRICGARRAHLAPHLLSVHGLGSGEYRIDYPEAEIVCETSMAALMKRESPSLPHWEPLWSAEYALDRLYCHHRLGHPVSMKALHSLDPNLVARLQHYFGSIEDAIRRIGLEPEETCMRVASPYAVKEDVVGGIRLRLKEGLRLNAKAMMHGESSDVPLSRAGRLLFGSWDRALEASGLSPETIRIYAPKRYTTGDRILAGIRERAKMGLPLNYTAVEEGPDRDPGLVRGAVRFFGAWDRALLAAWIDPEKARLTRPPRFSSPSAVLAGIHRRLRAHSALNCVSVCKGPGRDHALFKGAVRHFGSWDAALAAAGLNPQDIRRRRARSADGQAQGRPGGGTDKVLRSAQ